MSSETPAEFRARATVLYHKVRVFLIMMVVVVAAIGFLVGELIGHAIRAHGADPRFAQGPGWFLAGLIGLAAGAVCGSIVAIILWVAASLFYVMTQDGA